MRSFAPVPFNGMIWSTAAGDAALSASFKSIAAFWDKTDVREPRREWQLSIQHLPFLKH
jgi:hypothetical protein